MQFSPFDNRNNGGHNSVGLVEITKISVTPDAFSYEMEPFGRVTGNPRFLLTEINIENPKLYKYRVFSKLMAHTFTKAISTFDSASSDVKQWLSFRNFLNSIS